MNQWEATLGAHNGIPRGEVSQGEVSKGENAVPAVTADRRERLLDLAVHVSLAAMVAALAVFGYVSTTLRYFYPIIAFGGALYVAVRGERLLAGTLHYLSSGLMRWRWVFLIWATASLFWTLRSGTSLDRVTTLLQIYLLGLLFYDAVRELGLGRWVLRNVCLWTVVGVAIAFTTGRGTEAGRLFGLYGNPNVLALAALTGLAIFASGLELWRGSWGRFLTGVTGLLLLAGVAASGSRKGFIGAILIWVFGLIGRGTRRRMLIHIVVAIALGMVLIASVEPLRLYWLLTMARMRDAVVSMTSAAGGTRGLVERAAFIRDGLALMSRSPVFGSGIGSFRWLAGQGKYAHNNMIELGVGLGLVGLFLYYAFHLAVFAKALLLGRASGVVRRFVFVFVPTFLILDIGVVSYYMKTPALLLVVCAAWIERAEQERRLETM
ncbi:O-antigen ligase family protein [bacterium]|nr:O-antigen ligase family protein [bacterium]